MGADDQDAGVGVALEEGEAGAAGLVGVDVGTALPLGVHALRRVVDEVAGDDGFVA